MGKPKTVPLILLLSNMAVHQILLKHKLGDRFHIYPLTSEEFSFPRIQSLSPDFVIIDDQIFGQKIFSLCREFRRQKGLLGVPLLIISGSLKRSYMGRLIKSGATDFLREPLEEEELEERFQDAEKYRTVQKKMDRVVGTFTSNNHATPLAHRYLVEKNSLREIQHAFSTVGITIMMIQVDQEKPLIDEEQEELLETLRALITSKDWLFAIGPGKFFCIVPSKSFKEVFSIAQSMKNQVSLQTSHTISIGVASQEKRKYKNVGELLKDAKSALSISLKEGNHAGFLHT